MPCQESARRAALAQSRIAPKRLAEMIRGGGTLPTSDASVERGRRAVEQNWYKCHTQGEGGMGPVINDKPLPRFLMRFQIRHGLGTMLAFSPERISDQEVEDILNYLVELRRRAPG
jgi:mono/diheme cytochrome c family protein